jgi:hypothetical protein
MPLSGATDAFRHARQHPLHPRVAIESNQLTRLIPGGLGRAHALRGSVVLGHPAIADPDAWRLMGRRLFRPDHRLWSARPDGRPTTDRRFRVRSPPAHGALCAAPDEQLSTVDLRPRSGADRVDEALAGRSLLVSRAFRGVVKQRPGRGRSVVVGSGSDLLRSGSVQGSAGHAGLESALVVLPGRVSGGRGRLGADAIRRR